MQGTRSWKNIIWPTVCLAIQLPTWLRKDWAQISTFSKVAMALVLVWFTLSWINFLTNGRLTRWMDEDGDLEVPDDFTGFSLRENISPGLKLHLAHLLEGGDEDDESLPDVENLDIRSRNDALAVCAALKQALRERPEALEGLLPYFWKVGSAECFQIFRELGMPLVHDYLKPLASSADPAAKSGRAFWQSVKLVTAFTHEPAFPLLFSLSRDPATADSFWWAGVFDAIALESDGGKELVARWTAKLPENFASVAFLDWGNEALQKGSLQQHPFDTAQGKERLEQYLTGTNPEEYSYAVSAAAALGFLKSPAASFFDAGSRHPDPKVRVETAWAKARQGNPQGLEELAEFCQDWRTRATASRYLTELGKDSLVPEEASTPREEAKGTMAEWLAHPNELTRFPDSLEIMDHREIHWPPLGKRVKVTLFRWKLEEDEGIGMTGSITWSFFGTDMTRLDPLDIYARHCNWELEHPRNGSAPDASGEPADGRQLLIEANPREDWSATG